MSQDRRTYNPNMHDGLPMETPMDVRRGLTRADDINFKLRWGVIGASAIASDWIKSLQDVPGATVTAVAARDMDRAEAYAAAHGIARAYDSYETLCNDPEVDIVYISSKTWVHHEQLMLAIAAGKHVLCEKPFTDTTEQAREAYAAAAAADLFCQEGMWLRCFPAVEHARTALARGDIGNLQVVQADYPDAVYALDPAVTGFGADEMPVVAAAGRKPAPQEHPVGVYSGHIPNPSAVVLQYTQQEGVAVITFPSGRFPEVAEYIGTTGRISVEAPAHHPTALTIRAGWPPVPGLDGEYVAPGDAHNQRWELDPSEGWVGDFYESHWENDRNPSHGSFDSVKRFEYPVPTPAPFTRGEPTGSRWDGEKLIEYQGWTWGHGNQHGFVYQARAVHRCIAAGLKELPQFTQAESIRTREIIDEINRQCAARGF